jgi:hypothetical protein
VEGLKYMFQSTVDHSILLKTQIVICVLCLFGCQKRDFNTSYSNLRNDFTKTQYETLLKEHLDIANNFNTRSNLPPGVGVSLNEPALFPFWCLIKSSEVLTKGDDNDLPKLAECVQKNSNAQESFQAFFCHYLDDECSTRLTSKFGKPIGSVKGYMTPSQRTVILFPIAQMPFIVKLDGSWLVATKHLGTKEMENALAATTSLTEFEKAAKKSQEPTFCNDFRCSFEPESVFTGVKLKGSQTPDFWRGNLFRKLPPETAPEDSLVPFHSIANRRFMASSLGKKIFRNATFEDWFHLELIPKIANFVANSFFVWGTHLELHGQNLDILFDSKGKIKSLVLKDLSDTAPDPMLQISLNFATKNASKNIAQLAGWQQRSTFLNQRENRIDPDEVSARQSGNHWYEAYLRQLLQALPKQSQMTGFRRFTLSFHRAAQKYFQFYPQLVDDNRTEKAMSYFLMDEPFSWLILQLREAIVDHIFEADFKPNLATAPIDVNFWSDCRAILTGGESGEGRPNEVTLRDPRFIPGRFGSLISIKYRAYNPNDPPHYWACLPE